MCGVLGRPNSLSLHIRASMCALALEHITACLLGSDRHYRAFCSVLVQRTTFVLGNEKENRRDNSSWANCILSRVILVFAIPACYGTWPLALGVFAFFLAQGQPRESSPLRVGGGVSINERLIKAHCCHIPGRLSHLTNNIHHSFTQPPHILMAGRGPCDTGRTL
jgi:hypothetical protein